MSGSSIIIGFPMDNNKIIYSFDGLDWKNFDLKERKDKKREFSLSVKIVYDNNGNYYLTDCTRYHNNTTDIYPASSDSAKYSNKLNIYTSTDCLNWSKIQNPIISYIPPDNSKIDNLICYNNSLIICWGSTWLISNNQGKNWENFTVLNDTPVSPQFISTYTPSTLLSPSFSPYIYIPPQGLYNINPMGLIVANNYIFFLNKKDNMVYRTDLNTFTMCSNNIENIIPLAVAYDSNRKRYILCGRDQNLSLGNIKLIYYSDDGINWIASIFSFNITDRNVYPILGNLVHAHGAWWTSDLNVGMTKSWKNYMYSVDGGKNWNYQSENYHQHYLGLQLLTINNTLVLTITNINRSIILNITPAQVDVLNGNLDNVYIEQDENEINTFIRDQMRGIYQIGIYTFFTFPIKQSTTIDISKTNILNALSKMIPSPDILNTISSTTKGQTVSVTVPLPTNLVETFTNPTTYPVIADLLETNPDAPMLMATTTTNSNGHEEVDSTQIPDNSNGKKQPIILIIPSLEPGVTIVFDNVKILRGNGINATTSGTNGGTSTELSIDNSSVWIQMGTAITIGDKLLELSGIGSPVIFTITARKDTKPQTVMDYLFMYSYFFAVIGAIFYSVSTFISIDASSIIMNKNISVVFNAYITVCGLLSLCVWFNINTNFIISQNLFNQNVIVV